MRSRKRHHRHTRPQPHSRERPARRAEAISQVFQIPSFLVASPKSSGACNAKTNLIGANKTSRSNDCGRAMSSGRTTAGPRRWRGKRQHGPHCSVDEQRSNGVYREDQLALGGITAHAALQGTPHCAADGSDSGEHERVRKFERQSQQAVVDNSLSWVSANTENGVILVSYRAYRSRCALFDQNILARRPG